MSDHRRRRPTATPPTPPPRERADQLGITLTPDALAELDSCVEELSSRHGRGSTYSRSAAIRLAIAALHDTLFRPRGPASRVIPDPKED